MYAAELAMSEREKEKRSEDPREVGFPQICENTTFKRRIRFHRDITSTHNATRQLMGPRGPARNNHDFPSCRASATR